MQFLVALTHSLTQGLGPDWLKPIRIPKLLVKMIGLELGTEYNHNPGVRGDPAGLYM